MKLNSVVRKDIVMKILKKITLVFIIFFIFNIYNVYAESLPTKFDLRDHIKIEVRNQQETNMCWAFTATSLLSTHLAYTENEYYTFSPRHMEYVMSTNSLIGKENKYAYEGKGLREGGNTDIIKQYFIQGTGPVLEKNMPFINNEDPINESDLPLDITYKQVAEVAHILPMYKEWSNGELVYKDYAQNVMSNDKVIEYRNDVKEAIKEYGGVYATIAYDPNGFNNGNGSFNTKGENDNWHTILLIGWDDTYSKNNFKENVRPTTDGAYIALNSWGNETGDNGFIYVSYEDYSLDLISKTYIKDVDDVDFDNVYSNEDLNIAKANNETLTELSIMVDAKITGNTRGSLKIDGEYVLKDFLINDCLENYEIRTPVKLNSNSKVELEINVDDKYKQYFHPYYYTVTDKSQFETSKLNNNIIDMNKSSKEIYLYTRHNTTDNGKTVKVEILKNGKDYTSKFNVSGNEIKNNQTSISITPRAVENGDYELKLTYGDKEISNTIRVINSTYIDVEGNTNSSKGDISLDGRISVTDVSQLKLAIVNLKELTKEQKERADMNSDGKISVVDLSILKGVLVNLITL